MSGTREGFYRHYKSNVYKVICVARHTEVDEGIGSELVVYRDAMFETWARPRQMFEGSVVVGGKSIPRFTYIGATYIGPLP